MWWYGPTVLMPVAVETKSFLPGTFAFRTYANRSCILPSWNLFHNKEQNCKLGLSSWLWSCNTGVRSGLETCTCKDICKRKHEYISPLLQTLNWLRAQDRLKLDTWAFMYRVVRAALFPRACAKRSDMFIRSAIGQPDSLQGNLYEAAGRTVAGRTSLTYRGPRLWHRLPQTLKEAPSMATFKTQLRRMWVEDQWSWKFDFTNFSLYAFSVQGNYNSIYWWNDLATT